MNEELHNLNNNMRGTVYDTPSTNPNAPIRRGMITIEGAVMRFVVYPQRTSRQGRDYSPMQLEYVPDCKVRLVAVPVDDRG